MIYPKDTSKSNKSLYEELPMDIISHFAYIDSLWNVFVDAIYKKIEASNRELANSMLRHHKSETVQKKNFQNLRQNSKLQNLTSKIYQNLTVLEIAKQKRKVYQKVPDLVRFSQIWSVFVFRQISFLVL